MKTTTRSRIVTIFVSVSVLSLLVFTPAKSAERPGLLYATADAGSTLVALSLESKTTRTIGATQVPFSLSLAFCRPGKVPFTISNLFGPSTKLATLNLGRGKATPVGSAVIQPNDMMGMTCSPDGTLYAIGQSDITKPNYNSLYVIDRITGSPTLIGSLDVSDGSGNDFLMSLAFAPDRKLYGASAGNADNVCSIFVIDPGTGHATKVVDLQGVNSVMGLAIDSDGNFYVADFVPGSRIYAVDITTGMATPIMNTGKDFVHNIAFRTPG